MLYSANSNIAFAHYPKTAGTSISHWFKSTFPDAIYLEPNPPQKVSHFDVKSSIRQLNPPSRWHARALKHLFKIKDKKEFVIENLRIIGVLRDPFDMLVSLFEYWRNIERSAFNPPELSPLIITAREKSFFNFLGMAMGEYSVAKYRDFFDVGGKCWANTRLLSFENLNEALLNVCKEFDIPISKKKLEHLNPGPELDHTIHPYLRQAGSLINHVEQHFHWYYNEGQKIMVSK